MLKYNIILLGMSMQFYLLRLQIGRIFKLSYLHIIRSGSLMRYKPGMNLTKYYERYDYFPKLTHFIFGELAYQIRSRGFLEKEDFILIWLWKTQLWQIDSETGTFKHTQKTDVFETDEKKIKNITKKIFQVNHLSRRAVAELLGDLQSLTGVGHKVATAILSVIFPDKYGVVDVHVLDALGLENSVSAIHSVQYPDYVRTEAQMHDYWWTRPIFMLREIALEQMQITGRYWSPRMVDMALWVMNAYKNR
jgi:hypothetical protein